MGDEREYFYALAQQLFLHLPADGFLQLSFYAEHSDFLRFNHAKVRQAGHVKQHELKLHFIRQGRQANVDVTLGGVLAEDVANLKPRLQHLADQCERLPKDPFVNWPQEIHCSDFSHQGDLPGPEALVALLNEQAHDLDLVGIFASGEQYVGYANSLGQRNWHHTSNFNLDWSCYYQQDRAIKSTLAGQTWDASEFDDKLMQVRNQKPLLQRPAKTIAPGRYRVYLSPSALQEIVELLGWGGFSLKSHRTAQTPLLKMLREDLRLHPSVTIEEDNTRGLEPIFTQSGFVKPKCVSLIENGRYNQCLISPRSSKEYAEAVNCEVESPDSLSMAAGSLDSAEVLPALDRGIYINNLWYCNYSDRNACRITGMTRFACYWVEHGVIQAPLNVMRFDDSVYQILGEQLLGLSEARQLLIDPSTYQRRSLSSQLLPGVLVGAMSFTL